MTNLPTKTLPLVDPTLANYEVTARLIPAEDGTKWHDLDLRYAVTLAYNGRKVVDQTYTMGIGHIPNLYFYSLGMRSSGANLDTEAWARGVCQTGVIGSLDHGHKRHPNHGEEVYPEHKAVVYALFSDAQTVYNVCGDFEDWCSNLGYDSDSRKALAIFEECQVTYSAFWKTAGLEELARLAEVFQDY